MLGTLRVDRWFSLHAASRCTHLGCCRAIDARSETESQRAMLMCILVLNASYGIALFLLLLSLQDATHLDTVVPPAVSNNEG